MPVNFYVQKRVSTKTNNSYVALFCDVGYRSVLLTCDRNSLQDILGIYGAEYAKKVDSMKTGDKIEVK